MSRLMQVRSAWKDVHGRFFVRLLAGVLATSLPAMILLAVLLSRTAAQPADDPT